MARLSGLLIGLGLSALAAAAWSIPAGTGVAGAEVSMLANDSGELDVRLAGRPFLRHGDLLPGQSTSGELTVRNQTPKPLSVRLRASAEAPDLERILDVVVTAEGRTLYRGGLDALGRWTARRLELGRGESRRLHVTAALPADPAGGSANRAAEMTLELRGQPVED